MRPIWKGSIAFGLVNIPVRLYSATESQGLAFHMLYGKDLSRIRWSRSPLFLDSANYDEDLDLDERVTVQNAETQVCETSRRSKPVHPP